MSDTFVHPTMSRVNVSAGTIEYEDTGGPGHVIVLVHGLLMDGAQWRHVVTDLRRDFRCLLPTLPMGAHRIAMQADADLSLRGLGRVLTEFMERLDLRDVTLCFNDWCGAQVMIADRGVERVGRLVLVSCETSDNYPPGLPGRLAGIAAKVPGALPMMRRTLRWRWFRRLPITFGHMTKRGIPDDMMRAWLEPLAQSAIRRDYRKYAGDTRRGKRDLLAATPSLRTFERPVLVVWASEDRVMPLEHGRRLAAEFPMQAWSRSGTATRWFRWTSPQLLPPTSPTSRAQARVKLRAAPHSVASVGTTGAHSRNVSSCLL
jgi:pimeloyl-ACP methyl ester carboxylesterase